MQIEVSDWIVKFTVGVAGTVVFLAILKLIFGFWFNAGMSF